MTDTLTVNPSHLTGDEERVRADLDAARQG